MVVRQTSVLCPSSWSADNWHLRYHTGYRFFRLTCVPQNCTQSKIITVWSMQLFTESWRNGPSMLVDLIVMSRDYSYKYFRYFLFREFIHHRFISTWRLTLIFLLQRKKTQISLEPAGTFFSDYDPSLNPTLINSFATAALRIGHSMIRQRFSQTTDQFTQRRLIPTSSAFFNPTSLFSSSSDGIGEILQGLVAQASRGVDR